MRLRDWRRLDSAQKAAEETGGFCCFFLGTGVSGLPDRYEHPLSPLSVTAPFTHKGSCVGGLFGDSFLWIFSLFLLYIRSRSGRKHKKAFAEAQTSAKAFLFRFFSFRELRPQIPLRRTTAYRRCLRQRRYNARGGRAPGEWQRRCRLWRCRRAW